MCVDPFDLDDTSLWKPLLLILIVIAPMMNKS